MSNSCTPYTSIHTLYLPFALCLRSPTPLFTPPFPQLCQGPPSIAPQTPTQFAVLQVGYPCLSLHGAKDQSDRESTINDFKTGVSNVLVATSIAARGLDVKDLVLVVNYETPNHHEDYVHRVGRTGRQTGSRLVLIECGPVLDLAV